MIRYKKRILTSILVILVAMSLCACGIDTSTAAGSVSQINQSEQEADIREPEDVAETVEMTYEETDEADEDEPDADADFDEPIEEHEDSDQDIHTYVLNTNTKKFHKPDCRSVDQMKDKNKLVEDTTRDDVISRGYDPCGNCRP